MTATTFNPETTLVILSGASNWHNERNNFKHDYTEEDNPFKHSVDGMRNYFLRFLEVPKDNFKDLFDSQDNADTLIQQIEEFLKKIGTNVTDVFIYYVGHGTISTGEFCFAIPSAKDADYDLSAKKLWRRLGNLEVKEGNNSKILQPRYYFILDACFSGNITKLPATVPNGPKSAVFFCSALNEILRIGKNKQGKPVTVFTEALLKTLHGDNSHLSTFFSLLSFNDIKVPLKNFLEEHYPTTAEPHFSSAGEQRMLENLKLFKNYRLLKIKEEFFKQQGKIPIIAKSVRSYLQSLENKEINEHDKQQLVQLTAFLTDKMTAQAFIEFWQTHPVTLELNYQELSEKLQQGKIVIFLGANVPKQDAMLLSELKEKIEYHSDVPLSQLCEYIEMEKGRNFLCCKVDDLPQSVNAINVYELLATLQEPLTIISTEYTTLLEETFKRHQKLFVTLSTVNNWRDSSKKGKLLLKRSDVSSELEEITLEEITEEELSTLDLEKYTLIYKIRGCFGLDKQHLILSESDYFNFARSLEDSIPAHLIYLIKTLGLLFIDYYPKQWEDRLIAQTILPQSNIDITAIHGETDSSFIKTYWRYKGVVSYSVKISEFVEKLSQHLSKSNLHGEMNGNNDLSYL